MSCLLVRCIFQRTTVYAGPQQSCLLKRELESLFMSELAVDQSVCVLLSNAWSEFEQGNLSQSRVHFQNAMERDSSFQSAIEFAQFLEEIDEGQHSIQLLDDVLDVAIKQGAAIWIGQIYAVQARQFQNSGKTVRCRIALQQAFRAFFESEFTELNGWFADALLCQAVLHRHDGELIDSQRLLTSLICSQSKVAYDASAELIRLHLLRRDPTAARLCLYEFSKSLKNTAAFEIGTDPIPPANKQPSPLLNSQSWDPTASDQPAYHQLLLHRLQCELQIAEEEFKQALCSAKAGLAQVAKMQKRHGNRRVLREARSYFQSISSQSAMTARN